MPTLKRKTFSRPLKARLTRKKFSDGVKVRRRKSPRKNTRRRTNLDRFYHRRQIAFRLIQTRRDRSLSRLAVNQLRRVGSLAPQLIRRSAAATRGFLANRGVYVS